MFKKCTWGYDLSGIDITMAEYISELEVLETLLDDHSVLKCNHFKAHVVSMDKVFRCELACNHLYHELDLKKNSELLHDFDCRMKVMHSLGYVDADHTVQLKGRVAAEVNTCDALILSELLFNNVLDDLSPAESVALLSTLVFQQKNVEAQLDIVPEKLRLSCAKVVSIVQNIAKVQVQCGLSINAEEWVEEQVKTGLVHVIYEWASGTSFAQICELTDVDEGTIVRCVMRLDESCRDVRNCSRVMGNPELYAKMMTASEMIKRDVCFAASLYLT